MTLIDGAALAIHLSAGFTLFAFGVHQMVRPKAWLQFIPRLLRWLLPLSPENFMRSHGFINVLLGVWLMSGLWTVIASIAGIAWLLSILPFALYTNWTIGLRDFTIIAALTALLLLNLR